MRVTPHGGGFNGASMNMSCMPQAWNNIPSSLIKGNDIRVTSASSGTVTSIHIFEMARRESVIHCINHARTKMITGTLVFLVRFRTPSQIVE